MSAHREPENLLESNRCLVLGVIILAAFTWFHLLCNFIMLVVETVLQSLSFKALILWIKKQMKDAKQARECI